MAFCPYCGKEVAEGQVCSCQQQPAEAAPEVTPEVTPEAAPEANGWEAPAMPTKNNKVLFGIIGAVVAVLLIIVLLVSCGGKGYMKPITDPINAFNAKKVKFEKSFQYVGIPKSIRNMSMDMNKIIYGDDFDDEIIDMEDDMADLFDDLNDDYDKWKVKFEVKKSEKLDKKDLKEIREYIEDKGEYLEDNYLEALEDILDDWDDYEDYYDCSEKEFKKLVEIFKKYVKGLDKVKISEGYKVKGKFVVYEGKDELDKSDSVTFFVAKVNGEWVIVDYDGYFSFNNDGDDFNDLLYAIRYSTFNYIYDGDIW